ncbi:MAG: gamma-glutamyltransferase, partial [Paracoccaceae bacterium]|nr:gamma-glutamyltransferase [Paracoccaceae bacterium]
MLALALGLVTVAACGGGPRKPATATPSATEIGRSVTAQRQMIAVANPVAAKAGLDILQKGGSAVDAAIAAQMVLGLVEPQSSGIGGGGFMMHFAAKTGAVTAYDGRETAPASATPKLFLRANGERMGFYEAVVGGTSVGVPGILRMLEMAHKEHGKLPWKDLFQPAIELAEKGFEISPRLARQIAEDGHLKTFPGAYAYFYDEQGNPKAAGTKLVNAAYAETLKAVATNGADAFYSGAIARDIAATVRGAHLNPSGMTEKDIAGYQAKKREPVCLLYRRWLVCGMPPPSSGGITTLQILGMLQRFDLTE